MPTVVPAAPDQPTDRAHEAASFAADLSALLRSMPTLNTPHEERAAWFERKADLFDRVATTDPAAVEVAREARARAAELRRGRS